MKIESLQYQSLRVVPFVLGFLNNNTYVVFDEETKDCVVIDPSIHFEEVLKRMDKAGLVPREYWITHGHFDHYIGGGTDESLALNPPLHMHPADKPLFEDGGVSLRGPLAKTAKCPMPILDLEDNKIMKVGNYEFKVIHTPGHAPGHCCFYCEAAGWLFSGDLIFYHSFGRTDLLGGDETVIFESIRRKVLTLPEDTIIMPGHDDFTTVANEKFIYIH